MTERDEHPERPASATPSRTVRHALRTPLNHIIGYSELLLDEVQRRGLPGLAADLERIRRAGRELIELVDALVHGDSGISTAEPAAATSALAPAVLPAPAGAAGGHVLVVDDNPDNRDIVARMLASEGYAVLLAADGAEALARLQAGDVDLVLLDIMMPGMDGIEACRRLREDPRTRLLPVVLMTALAEIDDRVRGIRAGADDYLTKPVHREELLARVQTSLSLKREVQSRLQRLQGARDYLSHFVPPSVQRVAEQPQAPRPAKTDQDLTAMFIDVSAYGRLSEMLRQTADYMVEKYFSRYLDIILAHGGEVTETSGDGLMAVFAGVEGRAHARAAVTAAFEILDRTRELNEQLAGFFEPIAVHIGINSGIALVGTTRLEGTRGVRWAYTALGPAVNLAARIAGVAAPGCVLAGPETARRIDGAFPLRERGSHRLKNVQDEVVLYEVRDRRA